MPIGTTGEARVQGVGVRDDRGLPTRDANRDRLREAGRRVNLVRAGWTKIHDDVYGKTERKDVPFPGLFHVTEYETQSAQAAKLRHDLQSVINDMAAFEAGMPDLGAYAQRYMATQHELMTALSEMLRLLEVTCAGMGKRSDGDFTYTTTHFQSDTAAYHLLETRCRALIDSFDALLAGL
jgi:hypothetical protein